ncbi:MAG: HsdM family class I SAM-dependent methyltransferase [Gaiellaceae bacterium]
MSHKITGPLLPELERLRAVLDAFAGRYEEEKGASSFGEYASTPTTRADEETLTEQVLQEILESVLDYGKGDYVPQRNKSGLKPDFTPYDLVAHSFVFDAKGSGENLATHVGQIKGYVDQRSLAYGVLFNLREIRVYARGRKQHEKSLSFSLRPLWEFAHGQALRGPEVDAFERFVEVFKHREVSVDDKIAYIRGQKSWAERLAAGEEPVVDVDYLVEQLRRLALQLAADADVRAGDLADYLVTAPGREQRLIDELKQIALELAPRTDIAELPDEAAEWAAGTGLAARVWRQYLLRVAYLCLTRILLYRAWEDVQFVDEQLYDGGFDEAYERVQGNIREILGRAFVFGAGKYRTLFASESNYEWYRPTEATLVEVLYQLGPIPLGRIDQDALGALYVSYVDEVDRDRLGQFFTPRDVVRFMLDRAGFSGPDGLFRIEGDTRKPLRIFDFATGSGGFLVEAARRIIDDSKIAGTDSKGLREALVAVSTGLYGSEISPFPYYLTEINLLLQVSRLLGKLRLLHVEAAPFVLGVVRADTLATKSAPAASFELDPNLRADTAELPHNIYDVVPVEPEKRERYRELKADGGFDLVVGNPPYVAEANNKPLFDHLRGLPAWKGIYSGKSDYLYYFLLLAVEKLKPGGRLCVITPAAWMNAGSADVLRKRLAEELTLDELYLFGGYRLFAADQGPAPTPTVESAILVATKSPAPKGHKLRVVILDDEAVGAAGGRKALLDEMERRVSRRAGTRGGLKTHSVAQAELRQEYPWPVKFGAADVPTRVVAHLQSVLSSDQTVEQLESSWTVFRGIETAADAYSARINRRLSTTVQAQLAASGGAIGDPILELPPGRELEAPWKNHLEVLSRSPESRAILYAAVDDDDFTHLVRLTKDMHVKAAVLAELEPWRPLLATRAGFVGFDRPWWETHRARKLGELEKPKVFALYRADRGRFALDELGEWQPSNKTTIVVGKAIDAPVAYLCGLLNSELLDLWTAVRGKTPWHVRRNYEPKRMNEIPYRRPDGEPRADEIAALVRAVAANRRALLPLRPLIRELGRTIKDPWRTGPVAVDRQAVVANLPTKQLVSVRTDSSLTVQVVETPMGKPTCVDESTLAFRRGRIETGRVTGPPARIDLVEELVGARVDDVRELLLPRDLAALEAAEGEAVATAKALLLEGRKLVEEVERLVCALYGVPADLTEAVVEHAVARAARGLPAEE